MSKLKNSLLLLISVVLLNPSTTFASDEIENYRTNLDAVIEHTRNMLKVSNKKAVAEWVTGVVDDRLLNSNSEEVFTAGSPFNAFTAPYDYITRSRAIANMRSHPDYNEYDGMARLAWENKIGNCGENSYVTYYILKQAGAPGHVRILESGEDGAHSFAVWDLPPSAIINDPTTWGDGLVVDPWLGEVLTGEEAANHKWIKNNDPDIPIRDATNDHDGEAEIWNAIWREEMKRTGQEIPERNIIDEELEDCFIATAIYDTSTNDKIEILRKFRDQELRATIKGRWFISMYETFGPLAAYYISHNEKRKNWARLNLVEPAIQLAEKNMSEL